MKILLALSCFLAMMTTVQAAPAVPAPRPDIVVAADGSGDFRTVQAALNSLPRDNTQRLVLFIKDGVYHEKVRLDAACVTLRGQSRRGTRIEFAQLAEDFSKKPDDIGQAVVNINADDAVLENLTIANTAGIVGPHAFAIYGKADRIVITDCDVLSDGADTVALWQGKTGRYYHARCHFRGAVDFVCPRGWCYIRDSSFFETKATAAMWHDGSKSKDQKFVLRHCQFDGVEGWSLARHHHGAQFFWLDCTFSKTMTDRAPYRVIYPLEGVQPTEADIKRNAELDKSNIWGERAYFWNCHRDGGDYAWHANNLASAPGALQPAQITALWTFDGTWNPENASGPAIRRIESRDDGIAVVWNESVTVKGQPRLALSDGAFAAYRSGSGSDTLLFAAEGKAKVENLDLNGGAIIASEAAAQLRMADVSLPQTGGQGTP